LERFFVALKKFLTFFAVLCFFAAMSELAFCGSENSKVITTSRLSNQSKTRDIFFSSNKSGKWEIWSISHEGKALSQLTHMQEEMHYPSWSADHKSFVCATNEKNIWVISPGKSQEKIMNIPSNCNQPVWSPSGDRIAIACYTFDNRREDSDIWIYDVFKGKADKLASLDNIQSYPAWSPDGKQLVFTSGYRVSSSQIMEELWIIKSDGSDPRPIVKEGGYVIQPAWSPDGKQTAFASNKAGNMDIWVVELIGNKMVQLTNDPSSDTDPSWSPDGSKIVFTSTRSGQMQIWIMDSDGNNQKQLTGRSGSESESMQPFWFR
jgi:TolB protein